MKKRYILMAVTAALVFAVAAGGTLAANQVESIEDVSTPLAAQTLTIGLNGGSADINISAGGKVTAEQADIAFTAENTGDIDSFIRVTINKYWETSSGEYLPADNVEIDYGADSAYWLDAAKVEAMIPQHELSRCVGELGIGTNPMAKLTGVILEDEKIYGSVHVAFGTNTSFGGTIKAPSHIDFVALGPTVYFDDVKVAEGGQLLIHE